MGMTKVTATQQRNTIQIRKGDEEKKKAGREGNRKTR